VSLHIVRGVQDGKIKSYKVAETVTNAHPVIAGNRIFIKDQETLTLWTL